jgi:hypothetical protein
MSEISTPAPGAVPSLGAPWPFPRRFAAIFTSPRALFEHLAERPTWLVPLLVFAAVIVLGFVILMDPVIVPEQLARMEESGRASDQAVAMMQGPGKWITLVFGLLFSIGSTFAYAAVMLLVGAFALGGRFNYRQALSLVAHASLVLVPGALLRIPLAFATKSIQVSFGPGAFVPVSQAEGFGGKFLSYFLFGFDAFTLWQTALIGLGVAVIARVPVARAMVGVWVAFLLINLVGALLSAGLSGMAGG